MQGGGLLVTVITLLMALRNIARCGKKLMVNEKTVIGHSEGIIDTCSRRDSWHSDCESVFNRLQQGGAEGVISGCVFAECGHEWCGQVSHGYRQ